MDNTYGTTDTYNSNNNITIIYFIYNMCMELTRVVFFAYKKITRRNRVTSFILSNIQADGTVSVKNRFLNASIYHRILVYQIHYKCIATHSF